ncbi:putative adipose-regulatory protein-domain-containing protein [Russula aff. rugulosa BPL654]|nr:putative adipose-regulatory protein-domain-containing protein [Russula aff. rugulosa BPL654]
MMADPLDKYLVRQTNPSFSSRLAHAIFVYPGELFLSLISFALRPIAPQLIPLAVFSLLVPSLLIPAIVSGVYVWYSRAVSWQSPLFFQYGDGLVPYAETQLASFNPAQPYDISLHLVVPAAQSNYDLGNFMTTLILSDPSSRILTTVRKPAIILPPSYFRWLNPSTTTLTIPLLSRYVSGVSRVVARIELGRQDSWKSIGSGEGKELSVLTAFIKGSVRPQGVRGIISRFPLLSGVVASGIFLAVSFTVLAICLIPSLWWRYGAKGPATAKAGPSARSRTLPDALGERRARKRSLKRSGSIGPVKREDYEGNISTLPSAEMASSPLRRRRSRMSEPVSDGE